jgi:lysophospholipase L1-like esterase
MYRSQGADLGNRYLQSLLQQARALLICAALASANVVAAPMGIVDEPCPTPFTPSAAFRDLVTGLLIEPHTISPEELEKFIQNPELAKVNEAQRASASQDWAGLCRYRAANASARSALTPNRVVFLGDSITENWGLSDATFFEKGVVNRGISGQTSAQMLVRFRADVVALHPKSVHILAGTNDVAGNTGPLTAQDFENNIMSMVEIARANGIDVILGSIPPTAAFNWRPEVKPLPIIRNLNGWLRDYAKDKGLKYVDYDAALAGNAGELRSDLSNDGVHPNRKGYGIMRRLAEESLAAH